MKLRLTILAIVILSTFAFAGSASAPFASHHTASAQTVADDKTALTAFYNATGGANWTNNTDWLSDKPLKDWYGVRTNDDGRVITLVLSNNNLTGSIPTEIGKLSALTVLNLSENNNLTGSIPTEIGKLSALTELYLGDNQLSGSIPAEIGNLSNLDLLFLQRNQLTGSIPAEIGNLSRLQQLGFENNELTGSVPAELGNLSNLWALYLSDNQLSGTLPQSFTNLTTALRRTDLGGFSFERNAGLCAPTNAAFQNWLRGIPRRTGPN